MGSDGIFNPVRAGLVATPEEWPWSSASLHLHGECLPGARWPDAAALAAWAEHLQLSDDPADISILRTAASTGRPLGSSQFITGLETRTGHTLQARPRGRPRQEA